MSMTRSPPSLVARGCKVRMIGDRPDGPPPAPVALTGRGVRSLSDAPPRPDTTPEEAGNDTLSPGRVTVDFEDVDPGNHVPGLPWLVGLLPDGEQGLAVPGEGATVDGPEADEPVDNGRGAE